MFLVVVVVARRAVAVVVDHVCTMLRGGESEIEKLANVRALPGGGGML